MTSPYQKMAIAVQCSGYESSASGFTSLIGTNNCKSCVNCSNYENDKCRNGLFEKGISEIDETYNYL